VGVIAHHLAYAIKNNSIGMYLSSKKSYWTYFLFDAEIYDTDEEAKNRIKNSPGLRTLSLSVVKVIAHEVEQ
jgi:hypothetical protein